MNLVQIMDVAQKIVDNDYDWNLPVPPAPSLELGPYVESETDNGVAIQWSNDSESFPDFLAYVITKASERNADQSWRFDTLGVYEKDENGDWINQPPAHPSIPGWYELRDADVINDSIMLTESKVSVLQTFPDMRHYLRVRFLPESLHQMYLALILTKLKLYQIHISEALPGIIRRQAMQVHGNINYNLPIYQPMRLLKFLQWTAILSMKSRPDKVCAAEIRDPVWPNGI